MSEHLYREYVEGSDSTTVYEVVVTGERLAVTRRAVGVVHHNDDPRAEDRVRREAHRRGLIDGFLFLLALVTVFVPPVCLAVARRLS